MPSKVNETITMKVFPKGQVVIPVSLRKRYNIDIGDQVQAIPSNEGILLKATPKKRPASGRTDRLFGIFRGYAGTKRQADKKAVTTATENGFTEGWKE